MAEEAPAAAPTKTELDKLTTEAALQYSLKNYTAAAELYADAAEAQDKLNGEMAPENAELLFNYGRTLFKVAIAKSDVLGNKVASEEKKQPKPEKKVKTEASSAQAGAGAGAGKNKKEETVESKPFFQLTGDENWTDSEEEEEGAGEGADQPEEEQDDLMDAYEILEMARVCLNKQLDALESQDGGGKGKGKAEETPQSRQIKDRLADTHDLLAEISMENERFHDSIEDARAALDLWKQIEPPESNLVTQAHYKLSLALEFASVAELRQAEAAGQQNGGEQPEVKVDMEMRKQATKEMELAIASLEARIKKEKAELSDVSDDKKKDKEASIKDAEEMAEEMRGRVVDLRADPTVNTKLSEGIDPELFSGLLQGLAGADAATQKAKIAEATKTANDVTGLVKKKAPKSTPAPTSTTTDSGSGKRKLEVEEDSADGKRAKTEEVQ